MPDRDQLIEAVMTALETWAQTTDHLHNCIGYGEGQACCIDRTHYAGHGRKVAELAVDALEKAAKDK